MAGCPKHFERGREGVAAPQLVNSIATGQASAG